MSEHNDLHPDPRAVSRLVGLSAAAVEGELILATLNAVDRNRTHAAATAATSCQGCCCTDGRRAIGRMITISTGFASALVAFFRGG